MTHQVLPSKLVDERITVRFEFMDELGWGETIASVEGVVTVAAGEDPEPEGICFSPPAVIGTVVTQKLYEGLPGVIYILTYTVTGSLGTVASKQGRLAILPSEGLLPPFIATYLTSRPYPYYFEDSYTGVGALTRGTLRPIQSDNYSTAASIQSGTLRSILLFYELEDSYSASVGLIAGTLQELKDFYTFEDEYTGSVALTTGTLEQVLIRYNLEDEYSSSCAITAGTLT